MSTNHALTKDNKKQLNEAIKRSWEFIKEMQSLGVEMPDLVNKIQILEKAVQAGRDIGKASAEAQESLTRHTANLELLCNPLDPDERIICEAHVARQFQARSINFTLNLKNKDSVVRNLIRIQLQRLLPQNICRMLELCRA